MDSGAANQYSTLSRQELESLPISSLAAENGMLFLWTTAPMMPDALSVMEAWGFTYKTKAFSWVKAKKNGTGFFFGMGFYTRGNTEDCLLGIRGKPQVMSHSVRQIVYEPTREHSRKPDCVRDRIVTLAGDLSRVELFARQRTPGWDVFGDEVEGSISL